MISPARGKPRPQYLNTELSEFGKNQGVGNDSGEQADVA
jgi:hypothetical protein